MDVLLEAAANVGFPMVVSIYLLTIIEGKMENLTVSINKLTGALEKNTYNSMEIRTGKKVSEEI